MLASSSSTIYENISDVQSLGSPLEELRLEDSGTFEGGSPTDSSEQIDGVSCSPVLQNYVDDKHIYTNIKEMDEMNNRPLPPTPSATDEPKRSLNNGWTEYETEAGRTYFYNSESGKSQWIPPRTIRTLAQVQAHIREVQAARECSEDPPCSTSADPIDIHSDHEEVDVEMDEENFHSCSLPIPSRKSSVQYDVPNVLSSSLEARSRHVSERSSDFEETPDRQTDPVPHYQKKSVDSSMMTSFSQNAGTEGEESLLNFVKTSSAGPSSRPIVHGSPATQRSQSFKTRNCQLKNVPLPQVLPTTSGGFHPYDVVPGSATLDRPVPRQSCDDSDSDEKRGSSGEGRAPVRDVRRGNMEKIQTESYEYGKLRKREWQSNFMYLTSAHLLFYKDEKSAKKHGNHYEPPLGVCDLRGATVSWSIERERKKRKIIQLELSYGPKYLLRTSHDSETNEWFESLRDVISNLPAAAPSSGLPLHPSVLDPSCAIVRNPSTLSNGRPHSTAFGTGARASRRGESSAMAQSVIETTGTVVTDEPPSRQTILDRLRRLFRTRPSIESLKERGLYKPEPVFGSSIGSICQLEKSLVPKFIRTVTELIETKGLEVDGLYRVSGNLSAVQRIRCQVDQDKYSGLVNEEDVHVLTGTLKLFFRELSEPLIPNSMTKDFLSAIKLQVPKQRFQRFDSLLKALPIENKETLKMLLRHLHRVAAHSDKNRMRSHALAIVFGPTLFHSGDGVKTNTKKKEKAGRGKQGKNKRAVDDPPPVVQSNSHLAFDMIMQGQTVEYLLNEHNRFEALQGPVQTHPSTN